MVHRSSRTAIASAITAMALTFGVAACTTGSGKADALPAPSIGPVPTITSSDQIQALPLDAYNITQDQYLTILNATRLLARACMSQYGFDWHGSDLVDVAHVGVDNRRLFLLIDLGDAEQYGYQVPPNEMRARPNGVKPSLPPDYIEPSQTETAVFNGSNAGAVFAGKAVPKGGCAQVVQDRLLPGGIPGGLLTTGTNDELAPYQQSRADSRVQAVFARWSACMNQSGFTYKTPEDANNNRSLSGSSAIATATADVKCKQQTNVVGVWWAVLTAYEKRFIEQHAQQLQAVQQQIAAVVRNASAILALG